MIGIRFIMLAPWTARKNFTSCGDEEAKRCDGVIERLGIGDIRLGLKVKKGL